MPEGNQQTPPLKSDIESSSGTDQGTLGTETTPGTTRTPTTGETPGTSGETSGMNLMNQDRNQDQTGGSRRDEDEDMLNDDTMEDQEANETITNNALINLDF